MNSHKTENFNENSLSRRATLTFASNVLQQIIRCIVAMSVTSIVVRGLGASLYGAWTIMQQTVGYLSLTDLRPMGTLKFVLAVRQHEKDEASKKRYVGCALKLWILGIPLYVLIGAVLVHFADLYIKVEPSQLAAIRITLVILFVSVLLDRLCSLPGNVLRGQNLEYKSMRIDALEIILTAALTVVAVVCGFGLPGLAIASIISMIVTAIARYWVTRREITWFGYLAPSIRELLSFIKLSVQLLFASLSSMLVNSTDVLLVGLFFNSTAAAVYSMTGFLARLLIQPILTLFSSVNSGLGSLVGAKEFRRVEKLRIEMHEVALFLGGIIGVGVLLINDQFLRIWIGDGYYGGDALNLIFVLTSILLAWSRVDGIIADCLMEFQRRAVFQGLIGVIGICLSASLYKDYGLAGIGCGLLFSVFCSTLLFQYIVFLRLGSSFAEYRVTIARLILMVTVFLTLTYFCAALFAHYAIWMQIVLIILIQLFVTSSLFVWGISNGTRSAVISRIRHLLFEVSKI